jgi:hypothetical protein
MEEDADEAVPLAETLQNLKRRHAETDLLDADRLKIARVRNAIHALTQIFAAITPDSIISVYQKSIQLDMHPKVSIQGLQMKQVAHD